MNGLIPVHRDDTAASGNWTGESTRATQWTVTIHNVPVHFVASTRQIAIAHKGGSEELGQRCLIERNGNRSLPISEKTFNRDQALHQLLPLLQQPLYGLTQPLYYIGIWFTVSAPGKL